MRSSYGRRVMMNYVPPRDRDWALFLDVDGTLLEIAHAPDAVSVPAGVRVALRKAAKRESGAIALVSGRSLADLDQLFAHDRFPAAAVHGVVRRDVSGNIYHPSVDIDALNAARARLADFAAAHEGVLIEDKHYAIAIHFRSVPELHDRIRTMVDEVCGELGGAFQVQSGKCVFEIKPSGYSKGTAVEAFMRESPFQGRVPVFVGDDATDENGFAAINRMNGISIRVGSLHESAAKYSLSDVDAVTRWLDNPMTDLTKAKTG